MKPEPPPLKVTKPCPKRWDDLAGDSKRRFCQQCQLHVHNLSAMSPDELDSFVARSEDKTCIAYELRPDGTMLTSSIWRELFRPFQRLQFGLLAVLTVLFPFLFSSCASRRTLGEAPSGLRLPNGGYVQETRSITVGVPMPPDGNRAENDK